MPEFPALRIAWWKPLLALALTAGGLALALRLVDFAQLQLLFQHLQWWWIVAGVGAFGVACLASAARWHLALQVSGQAIRPAVTFRSFLVGHFCTLALFGAAGGDLARSALYARWHRLPLPEVIASAPIERALGFAGASVVALLAVCVSGFRGSLPSAENLPIHAPGTVVALSAAGLVTALVWLLIWLSRRHDAESRLNRFLRTLGGGARNLIARPQLVVRGVALGAVTQFAIAFVTAGCLKAVGASGFVWLDMFWTLSVISVTTLVPSVGGLGVRESAALAMLGLYGIAPEHAVSAALLCFVVQLIWAVAGASLLWREERAFQLPRQASV